MDANSTKPAVKPLLLSAAGGMRQRGKTAPCAGLECHQAAQTLAKCSTREARLLLPYEHARRLGVLPLGIISVLGEMTLSVAAPPLYPHDLVAELRFSTNHQIKLVPSPREVLQRAIHSAYLGSDSVLEEKISAVQSAESLMPEAPRVRPDFRLAGGDVAQLLTALVDYAIAREASDVHLLPLREGGYVKIRVHGELYTHERSYCSLENHAKLVSRLKVLAGLDTTQRAMPQDGSFTIPIHDREVFARLSIMPTVHGEKAVIRLMNSGGTRSFDQLGLSLHAAALLERYAARPEGAILFSGPTGSGKSTTMYALLNELSGRNLSISTIEDPVETQLEGISQTSIDERRGLSYAACLKSILRQDPDVILLGEMRDEESARIALQAAVTGHLLLSTVHARNALEVFTRLRALNADMLSVAQAVGLIVCQRLVPMLCAKCKVIDLAGTAQRDGEEMFKAVGCSSCDYSGFSGASLIVETLEMHARLYEALVHGELRGLNQSNVQGEFYSPLRLGLEKLLEAGKIQLSDYLSYV